jgi:hypothetical protein
MKKFKLGLTAIALVLAISASLATKANKPYAQCPGNVAPAGCNTTPVECCFIDNGNGTTTTVYKASL